MTDLNGDRLVLSMRQLSRAARLSCRILADGFVSCEIWKALYVGLRVAFNSEFNTHSQGVFNALFEEIFGVKDVIAKYMKENFFFFKFHNYSPEQILKIPSENLGLLQGQSANSQESAKTKEIACVYKSEKTCLMNIMNHPVQVKIDKSLDSKIQKNKLEIEQNPQIVNKLAIFEYTTNPEILDIPKKMPYIITDKLKSNILDLLKMISFSDKLPILLEGPTSTGKTSVVMFLASLLGQKVYRVNNHKDTDLDEYIGSFQPSVEEAGLSFQDGVLTRAMREGSWLLLDELNLAKSEILEALNR